MAKKLLTQGIIDAMSRLSSGNWFEVNVSHDFTKSHEMFKRALRLCVHYEWVEEGHAISSSNDHKAYRLTPLGFAIYDRHLLS